MARKNGSSAGLAHKGVLKRAPAQKAKSILDERGKKHGDRKQRVGRPGDLDTSDRALADVLERIKATENLAETRRLTDLLERIIFHKQYKNA